jgi:hypothetical protein
MAFKKKADPISQRSKELSAQITALESQIKKLNSKIEHQKSYPRVRSTAVPHGPTRVLPPSSVPSDPIFERVEAKNGKAQTESEASASQYNDLGVRKYDLRGAIKRFQNQFRGPATSNPKLISYLAAGSINGLRPLRYEKRIARNRFIMLSVVFLGVLWGILYFFFSHR